VRRRPDKQARQASAMTPFTSCGRIYGDRDLCDLALKVQVSPHYDVGMASDLHY